ncbi:MULTISPECIES: cupin domain-containing protein [unclassified Frankia]|uniref:cupin domain-containing protein n=1 Tax=unclassified Frankia TaxID=2632575 RepID=UPI002118E938|nr:MULTISPECIES: cupin domain-containing protein [unclassified Frankia]
MTTTVDDPSFVYGMHGGEKRAQWKCLARRNNMFGPWEAVEWAWLPPGGASGEHLHSRTEQLDYIVSGAGVMTIDGRDRFVTAGDVVLTALGTRHGLRNAGSDELVWLVTEVPGPVLGTARPGPPGAGAAVIRMREAGEIDPTEVLSGPLRRARLVRLDPGASESLLADAEEHVLYTLSGAGVAANASTSVRLRQGVSVSVPFHGSIRVEAGREGLEFFVVSLAVELTPGRKR